MRRMSGNYWSEAKKYLAGGVNSPVRAFKSVGGTPLFISRGKGSKIYDARGKEYLDYCLSWGPLILGHTHPQVMQAVKRILEKGTSFGAPTVLETELAKKICQAFPSIELVRLVNSGTEAVMSAIRLARGYTKRNKIIKFSGCYHGHSDYLLVAAGSGATTLGIPDSLGVPKNFIQETIVLPYNDIEQVTKAVKKYAKQIAAIIIEPAVGNMGVVLPKINFLHTLRKLSNDYQIVLIFDEVITGFRLAYGGAQEYFGLKADLTCLGKIIGGGFPVGAYGGKKEIMQLVAPLGGVYQAGTLSGNPVAVTAGLETLKILSQNEPYKILAEKTKYLVNGIKENATKLKIKIRINSLGSMFTLFFTDSEVYDYQSAKSSDTKKYARYFHLMLKEGIYLPPSQFEANFLSTVHHYIDIEKTIKKSYYSLKSIR
jgi:glutamate-1-semialdehyde 2,1-aminomutase